METHKKLIKPTPLLSIKPKPRNPEKPDQTHITLANQARKTQPYENPKKPDQTHSTIVDQTHTTIID